jgi:SAM-dependent methyltransferase
MNAEWYKHFFYGIALDFWRAAVAPNTLAEVEYVQGMLNAGKGSRLLDIPCGEGRHARELAARGFHVTGVDLADENIRDGQAAAKARGVKIEWRQSDMRDLPWTAEFDGAYCLGNSFGYLDDPGMRDFVQAVGRALKPGGRFVIDTAMAAESIIPNLDENWWMKLDDGYMLIANHYLSASSRLHIELTFIRGGIVETRDLWHRVYTVAEIRELLNSAGLKTVALQASVNGEEFEFGCEQLWITAEKT